MCALASKSDAYRPCTKAKIPHTAVCGWFKSWLENEGHRQPNPPHGSAGIIQVLPVYLNPLKDFCLET